MPIEEINAYTPQLYRSLGTPVTLNLGSTADDITRTRDGVAALPKIVGDAVKPISESLDKMNGELTGTVNNAVTKLDNAQTASINAARDALKEQASEHLEKVLTAIADIPAPAPVPVPVPAPVVVAITEHSAPLVRPLTQVLTLGIDAAPGQPDKQAKPEWGENVTLAKLLATTEADARQRLDGRPELLERYLKAFARFKTPEAAERHHRYAEVYALIPEITAHLG